MPRDPYSPIPDESQLPAGIRARRRALRGIDFDTERQIAWAERELAPFTGQALLSANPGFEMLFATHAVSAEQTERLEQLVPGYTGTNFPASFWLGRV